MKDDAVERKVGNEVIRRFKEIEQRSLQLIDEVANTLQASLLLLYQAKMIVEKAKKLRKKK